MYLDTVKKNAEWFRKSGVMIPATGEWGVAERIVLFKGNEKADVLRESQPAFTDNGDYGVVEHRRPDCNFETTLMFQLLSEAAGCANCAETAGNIMDYLFFRSGLLNRTTEKNVIGSWNWSSAVWFPYLWFDDDAWCAAMELLLAKRYPAWEAKYSLKKWGMTLSKALLTVFRRTFQANPEGKLRDPEKLFCGDLELPHWGIPMLTAFLLADQTEPDPAFRDAIRDYGQYMDTHFDTFNASELSYLLIFAPLAAQAYGCDLYKRLTDRTAEALLCRFRKNKWSNLPSEHGEAPLGEHLADTIYTINWAFLGFVNLAAYTKNPEHRETARKIADMLVSIQDTAPETYFHGAWRGMYDFETKSWGGGDCVEGGANSIYTGWTNAPISIGLLLLDGSKGLADLYV